MVEFFIKDAMALRSTNDFHTTQWGLIAQAADSQSDQAQTALQDLCSAYWYPVYAHVRRSGKSVESAEDLTQEFFCRMLEKKYLKLADSARGRFRTFLLTSLKHFLISDWEKDQRLKRGGGQKIVHLDDALAETLFQQDTASGLGPEISYDKEWATALIRRTTERLSSEYLASGKSLLHEKLSGRALGEGAGDDYRAVAQELTMSEGAVRVAVHRLRERYRQILRAEVANTVATPEEVEDELRHLIAVLRA
ncbi:MAG TPA: sigma factor [Candidatus Saccharimonadales bacterium]|nr:sigma factor [Candidatus Saccharimonadales bacterium]